MYYYPNTAEQFCQVGAYSPQIRLPPPMEAIPRTRHSLSPMCFFNGGSCFLCHHPQKVPGNCKNPTFMEPASWLTNRDGVLLHFHLLLLILFNITNKFPTYWVEKSLLTNTINPFCWVSVSCSQSRAMPENWSCLRCNELALCKGAQGSLVDSSDDDCAISSQQRHVCSHQSRK